VLGNGLALLGLKYLTLIRAIALLHQHQRPRLKIEGVEHIEVTLTDIAEANRLAGEVLGRSIHEMPPQTRRFLDRLHDMVSEACAERQIEQKHYRFTQREARAFTNWTAFQVKKHLGKLVDLEYVLVHRGGRGQQFVYELVYGGEGRDGARFLMGLIDVEKLAGGELPGLYDGNREHLNGHREPPGSTEVAPLLQGGSTTPIAREASIDAAAEAIPRSTPRKYVLEAR